MDSITHIVTGALVGEIFLGKKLGKKALALGAVVGSVPDVDVIANFIFDPARAAVLHRGITHSLLFALIFAWLPSRIFEKYFFSRGIPFRTSFRFFLTALLLHDLLDLMTCYGTGLLEPFTHHRFTLNVLFIADPLFTLPFLACFIFLLIASNKNKWRLRLTKTAFRISTAYIAVALIFKFHVRSVVQQSAVSENIPVKKFMVTPAPLNIFLWYAVIRSGRGCYTGYYSVFDKGRNIKFSYVPRNDLIMILFPEDEKIELLKRFSKGYYCFMKKNRGVYFNDLRFGRAAGWVNDSTRFVFSYNIRQEDDSLQIFRRTDFDISMSEAFKSLVKRTGGIRE